MISFENDYNTGDHEKVLKRLVETNMNPTSGYGNDEYCTAAKEKIGRLCGVDTSDIHMLVGGTQTNSIIIATMLNDCEGVISADTGHINVHEAGAIEYTGHKIITLPNKSGKLDSSDLEEYLKVFYADPTQSHMVYPGMVYISFPTELGTIYSKKELEALYEVCRKYELPLFIDGARLIYALACDSCDLTLKDIAALCDVFYIGGTKCGTLFGEAVVFTKNNTPKYFDTLIKQHGALLAKRWLIGMQFDTLFTDDLYVEIGRHTIETAMYLKNAFVKKGHKLYIDSPSNQQYVIFEDSFIKKLEKDVKFGFWEKIDENHTAVRFVTSWSTKIEDIDKLKELL